MTAAATPVPRATLTEELGSIGLPGGNVQDGFIQHEFLPELRGLTGMKRFREMADNDPVLGALLWAIEMPIRNLTWRLEPADQSDAAIEARDWLQDELFVKLKTPFPEVVNDILTMLIYGYSLHELVFARRGGRIGLDKIALRAQETIFRWRFDPAGVGDLLGAEQFTINKPGLITIPAYKFLLFRTTTQRNNPEGRSLLRNAYTAYRRKDSIEQAEGRAAIRSAGIVVMRIPGRLMRPDAADADKAVYEAYKGIAASLAQDRQGSVVLPSDVDPTTKVPMIGMEYVIADGRRPTDMTPIIERYDKRMAMTVLADWILLGQQAVGSFALSEDKTSMFALSCSAMVAAIADPFNRVLFPRLWALNGLDPATMPMLKASELIRRDLEKLGAFLERLGRIGMPLFPDPKLEAALRDAAQLPPEESTQEG